MKAKGDAHYLEKQPQWLMEIVPNTTVRREYGIHRSSQKIIDYLHNCLKKYLEGTIYKETNEAGEIVREVLGVSKIFDPVLLEEVILCGVVQQKVFFSSNRSNEYGRSAGLDDLYAMDNITLQAVTQGIVELPSGRRLHGGVWLRILRTLIEELNSPVKIIGSKTRSLAVPFWQELNLFVRQGFGRYTLFEQYDCNKQLRLMLVAALVFKAIFSVNLPKPSISFTAVPFAFVDTA
jgi:hypothetical protein